MSTYTFLLLAAPWFVSQAAPPSTDAEIRQSIEQLGADRAADREAATQKLWAIGKPAEPALREALRSEDLEVVFRARYLLEQIALGVEPGTPPEIAEKLRRVLRGDKESRRKAIEELADAGYLERLIVSLKLEPDEALRKELLARAWEHGRKSLAELLDKGQLDTVQPLLELAAENDDAQYSGARDLAAFILITGRKSPLAARDAVQAYLLRARGDANAALSIAERAALKDLRMSILFDRGEFHGLTDWHPQAGGIVALGYTAARHRLMGDRKALDEDMRRILTGDLKSDNPFDGSHRAILFLSDRYADALDLWADVGPQATFEMLRYQGRYAEALSKFGIIDLSQDLMRVLKAQSAPGNDGEARDAARFGWGLEIARTLHSLGETERATALLAEMPSLVERHLERPQFMMKLAQAEYDLGLDAQATARAGEFVTAHDPVTMLRPLFPSAVNDAACWWRFLQQHDAQATPAANVETLRRLLLRRPQPLPAEEVRRLAEAFAKTGVEKEKNWPGAIAQACIVHGQRPLAIELLKQTIQHEATGTRYLQLADLLAEEQRWEEAASWYRRAWERDRSLTVAVYLEGHALNKAGRETEGKSRLELARLLPLAGGSRRTAMAAALKTRGLIEDARREWELVLALGTFDDWATNDAAQQLGNSLSGQDDRRTVLLWERLTCSLLVPDRFVTKSEGYLQLRHVVNKVRARALLAEGKVEEAIEPARLALAAAPNEIELGIELCPKFDSAGRKDIADELFEGNYKTNESVLETFTRSSTHHNKLAWLSAKCHRRLADALAHAQEAVKLAPKSAACQDTLAEVHFQRAEKEQAIAAAKRTLELAPGDRFFESQLKRFQESEPQSR